MINPVLHNHAKTQLLSQLIKWTEQIEMHC